MPKHNPDILFYFSIRNRAISFLHIAQVCSGLQNNKRKGYVLLSLKNDVTNDYIIMSEYSLQKI